jgi:hypothetical protein
MASMGPTINPLMNLPKDVRGEIYRHLAPKDLRALHGTDKRLQQEVTPDLARAVNLLSDVTINARRLSRGPLAPSFDSFDSDERAERNRIWKLHREHEKRLKTLGRVENPGSLVRHYLQRADASLEPIRNANPHYRRKE